jgi:hypothetical protein
MFMKTFEEKWTAWIDGKLTGEELAEFKASLPDLNAAKLEKEDSLKLGNLLRRELGLQPMTNADFFNHQLRTQIDKESAAPATREASPARMPWWSIGRLAWAGAASLAIFGLCTFFVMRDDNVGGQSGSLTQIMNTRLDPDVGPDATVSIFDRKEDKVTVIWVDGLQTLPSEYAAK